jgi:hypothetical protein
VTRPYVLAADLGQAADHTAVVGLRRAKDGVLECIGIERLPLGMGYPAQVRKLVGITRRPEVHGRCVFAVDATGVGSAVVDLLRPAVRPTPFYAVTITAGDTASRELGHWRVPKRDIISAAQVAFQQRRVRLPKASTHAATLVEELLAYRVTISMSGHDSYGNDWRQAPHDDLVLAFAIGVYVADQTRPRPLRTFGHLLTSTRAEIAPLYQ